MNDTNNVKDKEYGKAIKRMKKRRAKFLAFWKSLWILVKYRFFD